MKKNPHQLSPQPGEQETNQSSSGNNVQSPPDFQLTAGELSMDDPAFVQNLIDLADYRFIGNHKHQLGWHNSMFTPAEEDAADKKGASKKTPKSGETDLVNPEDPIKPVPISQAAIDKYCGEVEKRLETVAFPTKSGTGFSEHKGGHRYMSRSHDKNAQAAAHTEYSKTAEMSQLGITEPSDKQETLWDHFKIVLGEEGDTSALNTWDAQIVTIGSGFGAKYGQAGKVLARLPDAYLAQLYAVGIHVGADGSVKYLDAAAKKVYAGREAWKQIKENHNLLGYITNLAQSTDMIAQNDKPDGSPGDQISMRNAMLKAQFDQFVSNNHGLFGTKFKSGPYNTRQMAIKMHHWLPGVFSWSALKEMPSDFDKALAWGKKKLKDADLTKYNTQYDRLKRFKDVTSAKKAKEYADRQFNR